MRYVLPPFVWDALGGLYYAFWLLPRAAEADEPDLAVVRAFLRRGDGAIDAGANFGRYTDAMALSVGQGGRILAIEPIPRTFNLLEAIVRRRRLKHVRCVNAAVSDRKGIGELTIPATDDGLNFYRASLDRSDVSGIKVSAQMDTLDNFAAQFDVAPVFVKLDLEGHERIALGGASQLLQTGSAWLLELPDDPDDPLSDASAIHNVMISYGYQSWYYDAELRVLRHREPGARPINLFYLKEDHLERFKDASFRIEMANLTGP